jgi:hypothetical protein
MHTPTNDEIAAMLVGIIADGFNRSLGALEAAGAIDCAKLRRHYTGVGSKYYDVVTKQIELTAQYGAPAVRRLLHPDAGEPRTPSGGA